MIRRALFALPVLAIACTGGETPSGNTNGTAAGEARDMLVYAEGSDIGSLLSVTSTSVSDSQIMTNIYMPAIDSGFDCSLKKYPGLVKEWEWTDDGKKLTFHLRDDIKWADGTPTTAHDMKFTYDLVADPTLASARMAYTERMVEGKAPLVIDDWTVEFHFTEAYDRDTQIAQASLEPVPKHLLENADRATLKGHELSRSPMPNGPFRLLEHKPNERIVLEPNPDFTGPDEMRPKLKRVMLKIAPEYQTRLLQLKKGEVDMMDGLQIKDADEIRDSKPELRLVRRGYRFSDYISWNMRKDMFKDKKVRQALAYAADVDFMIEKLLTSKTGEKFARPSTGTITPELCGVYNDEIKPLGHDPAKAKALLAEAGWKDTNGDGILDKGGKPFRFSLMTNRENERRMEAAAIYQEQLKNVGIDMQINTVEFNTMTDKLKRRDYDAALAGWSAGLFVDPADMWATETKDDPRQFNYPGYSNPEVDALIAQGLATPIPEEAAPIWKEMQAKIYDDQPYMFLWWKDDIVAIDSRFENTDITILSALQNLHKWEVPPDKVKYDF